MIYLKVSVSDKIIQFLTPNEQLTCIMRALNKLGSKAFTQAKRSILARYNLKQPQKTWSIEKRQASKTDLTFALAGDFRRLSVLQWYTAPLT